jgi:L-lysine 2,3-aminomutase
VAILEVFMMYSAVLRGRNILSIDDYPASQRFRVFTQRDLSKIGPLSKLPESRRFEMQVVSSILPFRVNEYVIEELIDWRDVPHDPIFQLCFPQRGMLSKVHFDRMAAAIRLGRDGQAVKAVANEIRAQLNPHPADQMQLNVPLNEAGEPLTGMQHKYRQTLLFFPSQGQTCHSYCTFCFRWAQFIGDNTCGWRLPKPKDCMTICDVIRR